MLDLWQRWIQFHELKIDTEPDHAPYILLKDILPLLKLRIDSNESVKMVRKDAAAIRIASYREYKKENIIVLLIQYADKDVTDPSFMHLKKGELRVEPKLEGEGVAMSAHAAISIESHDDIGIFHRFLLEEVAGLGRSRIQPFIRSEFKTVCKGYFDFKDALDSNRIKACHPVAEILGKPMKGLDEEFGEGVILQGIELVQHKKNNQKFDEEGYYSEVSRHIKLIPKKSGITKKIIDKIRRRALQLNYDDVKIRYKRKGKDTKQKTATLGATQQDLADSLIVRDEMITSDEVLAQCMTEISDSVARKMVEFIVELRTER